MRAKTKGRTMSKNRSKSGPRNLTNLFDEHDDDAEDNEDDEYEGRDPEYQDDNDICLDDETPDANWEEWQEEDPSAYEDGPLY